MRKLLVNTPSGKQDLLEVGEGGGYGDLSAVVWDEGNDGPMPDGITVGGMVRSGSSLVFSQDRMDQHTGVILAADRAQAWERIKAHRERLSDQGGYKVVVSGVDKWFHSDAKSKTQQLGLVIAGPAVPAIQWKTMDGTFITMSQAWAAVIFNAAATQDATIFAVAEGHRVAMMASENPATYDFSGGWPAVFGG